MNYRLSAKKSIGSALKYALCFVAGFGFISSSAFALPFAPNPSSFANWLNATEGQKRDIYFSDLSKCMFNYSIMLNSKYPKNNAAFCNSLYYTQISPQGKKVCHIYGTGLGAVAYNRNDDKKVYVEYGSSECVWR